MKRNRIVITYDNEITQEFNIISRDHFIHVIEPIKDEIWDIECKSTKQFKKLKDRYIHLKKELASYGRFCVVGSPIFNSVETQILSLLKHQGGGHKVHACMAELVDATGLKPVDPKDRAGSTPASGTMFN